MNRGFAGAFDARTLLALSEARARCILTAAGEAPGTMAAVRGSEERVRALLAEHLRSGISNRRDEVSLRRRTDSVIPIA